MEWMMKTPLQALSSDSNYLWPKQGMVDRYCMTMIWDGAMYEGPFTFKRLVQVWQRKSESNWSLDYLLSSNFVLFDIVDNLVTLKPVS